MNKPWAWRAEAGWLCALLAVLLFEGVTLWFWLAIDTRPPAWDESIHLGVSLDYADAIAAGRWKRMLEPAYFNYPPLYHLGLVPALKSARGQHLDGKSIINRAIFSNEIYLVLLGVALFLIGLRLDGPAAGFAAGVFGTAAPFVTELSHYPLIDLALSAWVAWAFYALIETEYFSRWVPTLLFGLFCAIGTLTKWSFFTYVLLPAAWIAARGLLRKQWAKPLAALAVFLIMILPWYLHNAIPVFNRVIGCAKMGASEGDPAVGSLASWLYYPLTAVSQLHAGLALLALAGIVAAFSKRERWIVLGWGLLPMVLWSFVSNKDFRYSAPCLGALAILAATAIPRRGRIILMTLCAAVLWGQFNYCFGTESFAFHWNGVDVPIWDPHPPRMEDWKQSDIARYCLMHRDRDDPMTTISTIENTPYLHSNTMNLNSRLENFKPLVFRGKTKRLGELSQFILTKTGNLGPPFALGDIPAAARFLEQPEPWFRKSYVKSREWPLPDGSKAILYERRIQPVLFARVKTLEMAMDHASFPDIELEGLSLRLSARTGGEAARGLFQQIEIMAHSMRFKGFPLQNVRFLLEGAQIDLPLFLATKEVRLMRLERAQIQLFISRTELQNFVMEKLPGVESPTVGFEHGELVLRGYFKTIPFEMAESIRLDAARQALVFYRSTLRMYWLPIPGAHTLLSPFTDRTVPLTPTAEIPFFIDLHALEWSPYGLIVR